MGALLGVGVVFAAKALDSRFARDMSLLGACFHFGNSVLGVFTPATMFVFRG